MKRTPRRRTPAPARRRHQRWCVIPGGLRSLRYAGAVAGLPDEACEHLAVALDADLAGCLDNGRIELHALACPFREDQPCRCIPLALPVGARA